MFAKILQRSATVAMRQGPAHFNAVRQMMTINSMRAAQMVQARQVMGTASIRSIGEDRPRRYVVVENEVEGMRPRIRDLNSLFVKSVGDLTEEQLKAFFEKYGEIKALTISPIGQGDDAVNCAWVNFDSADPATKVLEEGVSSIEGQTVEVLPKISRKKLSKFDSNILSIKVANKGKLTKEQVEQKLSTMGEVRLVTEKVYNDQPTGDNFRVFFIKYTDANFAQDQLNGDFIDGQKVYVDKFVPPQDRPRRYQENERDQE